MRLRRIVPVVLAVGLLLGVGSASAVRIGTSPTHAEFIVGSDWVGRVSLTYEEADTPTGKATYSIYYLRFANLCSRRGSLLKATMLVGKDRRFHYRAHGFTVTGHVIGNLSYPTEVVGFAAIATHGCSSGPWWFGGYGGSPN